MERKKIEKALFFHGELPSKKAKVAGKVLCLGSEFCPSLAAKKKEVEKALSLLPSKLSLYTSFLNEKELAETVFSLREILKSFDGLEIMLNDLGLLAWLKKEFPKVKKGIARPLSIEFMRMPYKNLCAFMAQWGLSCVETDEYDMCSNFPEKRDFEIYFRKGPVFSAMSRFCPFTRKLASGCSFQCRNNLEKFLISGCRENLYRYEKAYFSAPKKIPLGFKPQRIVEDIF